MSEPIRTRTARKAVTPITELRGELRVDNTTLSRGLAEQNHRNARASEADGDYNSAMHSWTNAGRIYALLGDKSGLAEVVAELDEASDRHRRFGNVEEAGNFLLVAGDVLKRANMENDSAARFNKAIEIFVEEACGIESRVFGGVKLGFTDFQANVKMAADFRSQALQVVYQEFKDPVRAAKIIAELAEKLGRSQVYADYVKDRRFRDMMVNVSLMALALRTEQVIPGSPGTPEWRYEVDFEKLARHLRQGAPPNGTYL